MALEDLLKSIRSKSEAEADHIIGEANKRADKILSESKLTAETEATQLYDDEVKRCMRAANQQISKAGLESRNKILNFKNEIVQSTFNEALKKLQNIDEKTYRDWLKRKIISACESGKGEILLSEKEINRLDSSWQNEVNKDLKGKGLSGNLKFKFEKTGFEGGFILKYSDYEIVMTLENLLKEIRQHWLAKISYILFNNMNN